MKDNLSIVSGQIVNFNNIIHTGGNDINELKSRHNTIIHTLVESHGGEILDQSVDYVKIAFAKPGNALNYASGIFSAFSMEPRIPYRMGICCEETGSLREFIGEEQGRIAKQLSRICPEGAILLTEELKNACTEQGEFKFEYIGRSLLKGTTGPTEIFCLAGRGLYIPSQDELTDKTRNKNTIAVLPFHNTSSEKELDYICDGIAEEVIDSLTKSNDLFVTARSSSFLFRNKEMSILDISRKLNVSHILEGSIRKRINEYRISYTLVDCSTGYNVISDTLNASFDSLYDTEKEISKAVKKYFSPGEAETVPQKKDYYIDPNAYSSYLQGKFYSNQWEVDYVKKAVKYFEKALEIVPDYALAYAGLSVVHTHMALNRFADFRESITKAVEFAERSISSDPSLPDGFIARALSTFWQGNWYVPDFEMNITTALALSPCNAEIRMFNSMLFLMKGELKRSLSEILLSKELDPYSQTVNIRLGLIQYLNREYEDAHNTFLNLLKDGQNRTYNVLRIAWSCIMLKQYHKALEYLDESAKDYEYYNMIYGAYLIIYHALKDETNYFKYKAIIEQLPEGETCTYYNLAVLHKLMGNRERSIENLEKTLLNPMFYFTFMQYDEFWEEFHDDPMFRKLVTSKYSGMGNQLLTINSETKESIELKLSDFLYAEAQDNYTLIVFIHEGKKSEKMMRATLSYIENQLQREEIIRCHRSYLVNRTNGFRYLRTDNRAILKHPELQINIPVSRSKEKDMKELFHSAD